MFYRVIFGDARNMAELSDESVHLIVTSPPYYNAPFDYPNLFPSYEDFLSFLSAAGEEMYRVLRGGQIACIVCDDVIVGNERYPIVADTISTFRRIGFRYRDRITWLKPEGYIRISRRSGVLIQHPYPMYFYPDNIQESILIFQKGKFDYRSVPQEIKEASRIDLQKFQAEKWYLNVWQITNVLPHKGRLESGIAAFPLELALRLITLFSHKGEVVLDPFLGSGTTMCASIILERSCIGYEIDLSLLPIIKAKTGLPEHSLQVVIREDAKPLRKEVL